jgi:hypothetical protein
MWGGRRPRTAPENLERVPTNPPAHGAWNGRKGVVGTGEALLGPGLPAREAGPPITNAREVAGGREGVGGGRSSDDGRDNTTRPERRAPASPMHGRTGRGSGECPMRARSTRKAERLEKSRALQRVLYRSAKQDPNRRFHLSGSVRYGTAHASR